jgi:hypothetical protein
MDTREILTAVKSEISRLQKVVDLLEVGTTSRVSTSASNQTSPTKRKSRKWTAAQRKAMSLHQKQIWAKRKKRT